MVYGSDLLHNIFGTLDNPTKNKTMFFKSRNKGQLISLFMKSFAELRSVWRSVCVILKSPYECK